MLKFLQKTAWAESLLKLYFPLRNWQRLTIFCLGKVIVRKHCFTLKGNFIEHKGFGQFLSLRGCFWKCRILFFTSSIEKKNCFIIWVVTSEIFSMKKPSQIFIHIYFTDDLSFFHQNLCEFFCNSFKCYWNECYSMSRIFNSEP